jgi:hypothetical protein
LKGIDKHLPPVPVRASKLKAKRLTDQALFYDYQKHGSLEVGEKLILYRDGSFKKEGKLGR